MVRIKKIAMILFVASSIAYSIFSLYKIVVSSAPDFSVYYHAGLNALSGQSLYTHISFTLFAYPPISSLIYIPLTLVPYQIAQGVFVILSYACVWLSVFLVIRVLRQRASVSFYALSIALMLLSFPTKFTLGMGQSNLIALSLFLGAVLLDRKNKKFVAAILFAFAIIFKPIFAFLVLYFLFTRSFKTIAFSLVTGFALMIVQLLLFHATIVSWQEYLTQVLPGLLTSKGREVYYNQGLLGTTARLITDTTARSIIALLGSAVLLGGVLWTILKIKRDDNQTLALLLCLLPLIDSLSWQHHFVVLLLPMLYLFYQLRKNLKALSLLGVSYLMVSYNIKSPQQFSYFPVSVILSHVFWGTILLLGLLLYSSYTKRQR